MIYYRGKYGAFNVSSILHFLKTMKNWCILTLLVDSFRQFDQNQSVGNYVSFFVYSKKNKYSLDSVSVSVRPAVNTITFESLIQLSWNFVHRMISSISQSSSKMRRVRQEMAELSKKLSLLTGPSLRGGYRDFFQKKIVFSIIHNIYKSTQFLQYT